MGVKNVPEPPVPKDDLCIESIQKSLSHNVREIMESAHQDKASTERLVSSLVFSSPPHFCSFMVKNHPFGGISLTV